MKSTLLFIATIILSIPTFAQDISGRWEGKLAVQGQSLRIVFNLVHTESTVLATMDSPDQGARMIPVTSAAFDNNVLKLKVGSAGIDYTGTFEVPATINGTFSQMGQRIPLTLYLSKEDIKPLVRPQEPKPPFEYHSEDVKFKNNVDKVKLAGTLTKPKGNGPFPAVVLISGSGSQDRNEEIFGHKPFLVIADHLTKAGIAVLRYDDRGAGKSSAGNPNDTSEDLAGDVRAAVNFLKTLSNIDSNQIGLVGHSEGGMLAPMVAIEENDIAFMILLAGTGVPGDQILIEQNKLIAKANGMNQLMIDQAEKTNRQVFELIKSSATYKEGKKAVTKMMKIEMDAIPAAMIPEGMDVDEFVELQTKQITRPWMQYFIKYDPAGALQKVKCPVLALNGEKDLQVPAEMNLKAIEKNLRAGGNQEITIQSFPNLNHLFQHCESGSPKEYYDIEETISPEVLEVMTGWIISKTQN